MSLLANESDTALFEGLVDLLPAPSQLPDDPELLQALEAVPTTAYEVHADPTPASSAHGSDASSSSSNSVPASPDASRAYAEISPIDELLTLIDWKNNDRSAPKRVRGAPDKSHEKHVAHEKNRRNELAQAIDEISGLIPQVPLAGSNKRTKLATLQEAAEYFKRVQDMACVLLRENRRLAASLQEQPAIASAYSASQPRPRSALQGQDVVRLFVTTAFLVWLFVGVPTPWTASASLSSASTFSSRHVLDLNSIETPSVFIAFFQCLMRFGVKTAVFLGAFSVVWVITLLQDMPKISAEALHSAEALLNEASRYVERNSNWVAAQAPHTQAMAMLRKPLPVTRIGEHMFLLVQIVRAVLNLLVVGLWLERLLVYTLGRQEASALEARGFMLGCRLSPNGLSPLRWRPIRYFACILASASGFNVVNAPLKDKDELGHRIGVFHSDMPDKTSRLHFILTSLLVSLAEAQLNPVSMNVSPEDVSDWTLLRLLESPVHQGKLEEALSVIMRLIPALKGAPQVKALCSAGTVNCCLRRYREAFLMLQTAVKLGSECGVMPVIAVRFLTASTLVSLYNLGKKEEARSLLPSYESMYTCVPDVRANIMPNERHSLELTKIVLAEDDYPAVLTHTRELLGIVQRLGIQRCFNLPFMCELALERLFAAIQLANDAMVRPRRTPNETFVVHQRCEISEMAETLISLLVRCTNWATYTTPMVERAKGWLAFLNNDRPAASYHLNRSMLEARRMELEHQEVVTKEVMQKLGIPLLGDDLAPTDSSACPSKVIKECVVAIFGTGTSSSSSSAAVGAAAV